MLFCSGHLSWFNSRRFMFTNCGLCCQLIVVMASHCYLIGTSGELFVEYLVRHCALQDQEKHQIEPSNMYHTFTYKRFEVWIWLLKWEWLWCFVTCMTSNWVILNNIDIYFVYEIYYLARSEFEYIYAGFCSTDCGCLSPSLRGKSN